MASKPLELFSCADGRAGGGELVVNAEFLRFAAHWGFRPRSCRPYRAQTKGKVEQSIRYIRNSFFYGREFVNDEDLNEQALCWMEATANLRWHGTGADRAVRRQEKRLSLAGNGFPTAGSAPSNPYRRSVVTLASNGYNRDRCTQGRFRNGDDPTSKAMTVDGATTDDHAASES